MQWLQFVSNGVTAVLHWAIDSRFWTNKRCHVAVLGQLWGVLGEHCFFNSLRPSDAIWRQGSRSTLVQVMACCLTAPSHYLNQCWLIISEVQRHSLGRNFMRVLKSPRGRWVKPTSTDAIVQNSLISPYHIHVSLPAIKPTSPLLFSDK